MSTHNICFGGEIRKIIYIYALLSGGLWVEKHLSMKGCLENTLKVSFVPKSTLKLVTLKNIKMFLKLELEMGKFNRSYVQNVSDFHAWKFIFKCFLPCVESEIAI